jgi:hypothetical protein
MNEVDEQLFGLMCYLVLMDNGDGIMSKHPTYVEEKAPAIMEGVEAFGRLDIHNMRKLKAWCEKWGMQMPATARQYLNDSEVAAQELSERGLDI